MENDITAPEGFFKRLGRRFQWVISVLWSLLVLLIVVAAEGPLKAPGAPVGYFWLATAIAIGLAVALSPPAFFKFPRRGRIVAYLATLPAFVMQTLAFGGIAEAYQLTPEGVALEAERTQQEASEALIASRSQEAENDIARSQALNDRLRRIVEQQEACLGWGGWLSDLNDSVRDNLHNPSSFEPVETRFIVPGADRMNVLLIFRAENGFGALRTATVKAQMIPASCEIVKIGELEPA